MIAVIPIGSGHTNSFESKPLTVLDLRPALNSVYSDSKAYDVAKAIGALQGVVNRERPRLFVIYLPNRMALERGFPIEEPCLDLYWCRWLREEDRILADCEIHETTDVWEVIDQFQHEIQGLVLWDEEVPSTSNVASTIAGVESLLPVRGSVDEDSFHGELQKRFPSLGVRIDLRDRFTGRGIIPETNLDSTGSAKCDAYLWAIEKYLKTGLCSSTLLAYYIDGIDWRELTPDPPPYLDYGNLGLLNADYYIARKAFFFDLSPWTDVSATDDPNQPIGTDGRTLRTILLEANRRNENQAIMTCGGFVPWWIKYTNFKFSSNTEIRTHHEPVETEWHFSDVLSAYNTVMDADAAGLIGLANASVFQHIPLREKYEQNPLPEPVEYDADTTYVLFAMLDYDSAAWLAQAYAFIWNDPNRGKIPLLWGINPILSERVPMVFDSIFSTLTENDRIGCDEGLGYINPNLLGGDRRHSDLPDGRGFYLKTAKKYFERFDIDTTAFVITGHEGKATEEAIEILAELSPGGVGFQAGDRIRDGEHQGVAFKQQEADWPLHFSSEKISKELEHWIDRKGPGEFLFIRCILVTPTQLVEGVDLLRTRRSNLKFEILDAHNFYDLLRRVAP